MLTFGRWTPSYQWPLEPFLNEHLYWCLQHFGELCCFAFNNNIEVKTNVRKGFVRAYFRLNYQQILTCYWRNLDLWKACISAAPRSSNNDTQCFLACSFVLAVTCLLLVELIPLKTWCLFKLSHSGQASIQLLWRGIPAEVCTDTGLNFRCMSPSRFQEFFTWNRWYEVLSFLNPNISHWNCKNGKLRWDCNGIFF